MVGQASQNDSCRRQDQPYQPIFHTIHRNISAELIANITSKGI